MTIFAYRARWAALAGAAVLVFATACDVKDSLLEPQNPGLIDETAVGSPAAALALKVGAIGRLKLLVNCGGGECLWEEGGHLADEFKNSDFQPTRGDVDQRTMTTSNGTLSYSTVTTIRGYVRTAIDKMKEFLPNNTADIGELYMALAFVEMSMAETFCNGIPLGKNVSGVVDYSDPSFKPLTNAEVYDVALTHIDSGLTVLGAASDAASTDVRRASLIVKARILVNKAQFAAAAALVPVSAVPAGHQYMWTTSTASTADDLGIWTVNNSVARITVSDSFDIVNGQVNLIKNALPFASANDPRVPVLKGSASTPPVVSEDGVTPLFIQRIWPNRDDPIPMVSAIDARLIEAEAKLNANDIAGMMAILNQLRTDRPKIGNFTPGAMAPLAATPATKADAVTLFFREKAFWTFGRGQRLGDLRRLVRQYGRAQDQVFPSGVYFKGGVYGSDVNFPVPDGELVNPQFKGCLDRNA
jgi:hypothetical protein